MAILAACCRSTLNCNLAFGGGRLCVGRAFATILELSGGVYNYN